MYPDEHSTQMGESGSLNTDTHDNPNNDDTGQQQPELSPREAAMQAIIDKQQTSIEESNNPLPQAMPNDLPAELPVYQNNDGDYLMRLKVDGEEKEMSLNDVQATIQKHEAADLRLRQAAEAKRQLDEERRLWQEQQSQYQQQPPAPAGAEGGADYLDQAHQIIDTLYDGDPEQAAEALAQMIGQTQSTQQPAVNPQMIEQETRRALEKVEYDKALKSGFAKFQDEYADVLADPDLRDMADRKSLEIQTLHPDWSPEQVLMESGRAVRSKFQPAADPANTRQSRKQSLSSMPQRQANATYVPPSPNEPSNSPADVIAQMKKARGQI